MIKLKGTIAEVKTREDASGDLRVTVKLYVFGDHKELHNYMLKPLNISFEHDEAE